MYSAQRQPVAEYNCIENVVT